MYDSSEIAENVQQNSEPLLSIVADKSYAVLKVNAEFILNEIMKFKS